MLFLSSTHTHQTNYHGFFVLDSQMIQITMDFLSSTHKSHKLQQICCPRLTHHINCNGFLVLDPQITQMSFCPRLTNHTNYTGFCVLDSQITQITLDFVSSTHKSYKLQGIFCPRLTNHTNYSGLFVLDLQITKSSCLGSSAARV